MPQGHAYGEPKLANPRRSASYGFSCHDAARLAARRVIGTAFGDYRDTVIGVAALASPGSLPACLSPEESMKTDAREQEFRPDPSAADPRNVGVKAIKGIR